MHLLIFGASGSIGTHLVQQALAHGHSVKAFCRSPEKLSAHAHAQLEIVTGDVLDGAAVQRAMQGIDAVLCALGDGAKGIVRATGTQNILAGMTTTGVKRLVCQTAIGLGESRGNLNFFWKHIMFGMLLKKAFADHALQEKAITESSVDWTIVRPSAFADGPATGRYQRGFSGSVKGLKLKIARADVAGEMLAQLTSLADFRKAVSISN